MLKYKAPQQVLLVTAIFLYLAPTNLSAAESVFLECVGRSQFSLPEKAEVAAYSLPALTAITSQPSLEIGDQFANGDKAGYGSIQYGGAMYVSYPISDEQSRNLMMRLEKLKIADHKYSIKQKLDEDGHDTTFVELEKSKNEQTWKTGNRYFSGLIRSESFAFWNSNSGRDTTSRNEVAYENFRKLSQRTSFVMPKASGICIPMFFIPDDGKLDRSVSATYRLNSHPDVTIWLQDSSWPTKNNTVDQLKEAAIANNFFWSQNYQGAKDFRYEWITPHAVDIGGAIGVSTFVDLKRPDDSMDYGFFAYVSGRSSKELVDTKIQLYVKKFQICRRKRHRSDRKICFSRTCRENSLFNKDQIRGIAALVFLSR